MHHVRFNQLGFSPQSKFVRELKRQNKFLDKWKKANSCGGNFNQSCDFVTIQRSLIESTVIIIEQWSPLSKLSQYIQSYPVISLGSVSRLSDTYIWRNPDKNNERRERQSPPCFCYSVNMTELKRVKWYGNLQFEFCCNTRIHGHTNQKCDFGLAFPKCSVVKCFDRIQ